MYILYAACWTVNFISLREQLQQQHADFMATRRELAQTNRDQERYQRELEEIKSLTEVIRGCYQNYLAIIWHFDTPE